jgi:hypothetical protein
MIEQPCKEAPQRLYKVQTSPDGLTTCCAEFGLELETRHPDSWSVEEYQLQGSDAHFTHKRNENLRKCSGTPSVHVQNSTSKYPLW